ncbi:hypothetical protein GF325_05265 [Candidatus Bathyarchaeota archaeon]|nr:hypothetical protein [Candidatus Bathyarchaeota archaeon]
MREIIEEKAISIPEVKEILDRIELEEEAKRAEEEELEEIQGGEGPAEEGEGGLTSEELFELEEDDGRNYFLKSTHEYVKVFAKIESDTAKKVISNLVSENEMPLKTAIQIANINPDTPEELLVFFDKGSKRLNKEEAKNLLFKIREYREL